MALKQVLSDKIVLTGSSFEGSSMEHGSTHGQYYVLLRTLIIFIRNKKHGTLGQLQNNKMYL